MTQTLTHRTLYTIYISLNELVVTGNKCEQKDVQCNNKLYTNTEY